MCPKGGRVTAGKRPKGRFSWYNVDMIKFTIITLFQEAVDPYLKSSMMEKAVRKGLAEFDFVN